MCEDTEVLLKRTSDLSSEGWRRDFRAFVADIHEPLDLVLRQDGRLWPDDGPRWLSMQLRGEPSY